jgi:hypothetical protein
MTMKLTYNTVDYDAEIVAGDGGLDMDHAMVGETLTVDTLTVKVMTATAPDFVKNGAGLFYVDSALVGKYYLHELHQTAPSEYQFFFCSAIRLLDQTRHKGGLYTGQTATSVISEIMESIVSYSVDPAVANIQVYGYLPYASRRSNLQKLLMAVGAGVKNTSTGALYITELTDTTAGVFDDDRVFIGGVVIDKNPATCVQVTEHNFLESDEVVKLFDDTTLTTETVIFNEPYHDLSITGGTIIASGVNYCTFSASGAVVLTGKRYTHVTRVITEGTAPTGSEDDVVRSVSYNTLLTPNNAVAVAEKLYGYLSVAQSIKQEVIFGTERPADVVSVVHPYTKSLVDACLKSMNIQFGKTEIRAMCEFLVGYVPPGVTAGFQHYALLTGSGTWTVPAGVTRIRVILVGGGDGGHGGSNGANTVTGTTLPLNGGAGGAGGESGQGALILEINLTVTPGSTYSYSRGAGGAGGTTGNAGSAGGATTFGSLSSAAGRRYPNGYSEPKSGLTFAEDGDDGVPGGPGKGYTQAAVTVTYNGVTYNPGSDGTSISFDQSGKYVNAIGGGGGGAAVGNNGANGTNGWKEYANRTGIFGSYNGYWARHGAGGRGANAIAGSNALSYGGGGNGGHGGGGGGYTVGDTSVYDIPGNYADAGGYFTIEGGNGSAGGNGGNGAIVIYY